MCLASSATAILVPACACPKCLPRPTHHPRRSVTILPAALSPHSLASVPSTSFGGASFTFSIPRNLSSGSGLGGGPAGLGDEAAGAGAFGSESEVSESEADSRDPSQHGPARPGGWSPAQQAPPRGQ